MIVAAIICATVLLLALMLREHAMRARDERALDRVESEALKAILVAIDTQTARLDALHERATGWTATSRQVAAMNERRKQ